MSKSIGHFSTNLSATSQICQNLMVTFRTLQIRQNLLVIFRRSFVVDSSVLRRSNVADLTEFIGNFRPICDVADSSKFIRHFRQSATLQRRHRFVKVRRLRNDENTWQRRVPTGNQSILLAKRLCFRSLYRLVAPISDLKALLKSRLSPHLSGFLIGLEQP